MSHDTTQFSTLALSPELLKNLEVMGYTAMTPIQGASLGHILNKRDVIAQAKTGSGKTAAFSLGLLAKLRVSHRRVQALVLCPTRELSEQVAKEIRTLARMMPNVKVLTLCGGTPSGPQRASLEHGAHIIVGTPGRVLDHLGRHTLSLNHLTTLVLDEADRMLEMGFADALDEILTYVPEQRQTLLFSATFPSDIKELSSSMQKNAVLVQIDQDHQAGSINQLFFKTSEQEKSQALVALLAHYKPASTVVFCTTKIKVQELAQELNAMGYSAQALHGDLIQAEREQVLRLFANRSSSLLIATDVAARGLDIKELQAVINFDLSRDPEVHVHRIGRTGRAGSNGVALSLFTERDRNKVRGIEEYQQQEIQVSPLPSVSTQATQGVTPAMISLRIEGGKKNKLRPTDILGALTTSKVIPGSSVGKIDIYDFHTFVAIARDNIEAAYQVLSNGTIKGRTFKIKKVV